MKIETNEQASEICKGLAELEEPILVRNNYDRLSNAVTETLQNWGLLSKEGGQL